MSMDANDQDTFDQDTIAWAIYTSTAFLILDIFICTSCFFYCISKYTVYRDATHTFSK